MTPKPVGRPLGNEPVGLCGAGNMGAAIAERLAGQGPVLVYDPDPTRTGVIQKLPGVSAAASLEEIGTLKRVVFSLPSPEVSLQVCSVIAPLMPADGIVLETSTVTPADARRTRDVCHSASTGFVDVAVLSGVVQMRTGQATLLVGGSDEEVCQVEDVLAVLGSRVWLFGDAGAGMAVKVVNNAVAHAVMVLLVEAAMMAKSAGVEPRRLAELLSDPEAGLMRPLTHRLLERVLHEDYAGGMPTQAARKDSLLALDMAHDADVPLFVMSGAHTVYDLAVASGSAREDYAAIARLWTTWTGRSLSDGHTPGPQDD